MPKDRFDNLRKHLDTPKELKIANMITLQGNLGGDIPPKVVCGCGWEEGPDANLLNLGRAAKRHADETGHLMRPHDVER